MKENSKSEIVIIRDSSPTWACRLYLLLFLLVFFFHCHVLATGQSMQEQQQKVETLIFSVRPVVSSNGEGKESPYVDEEVPPYDVFTLTALLTSSDNRKLSAAKTAILWIQSHSSEIFRTTPDIHQAL
jgi:hypothetical protein